jgi:hypothetical protein
LSLAAIIICSLAGRSASAQTTDVIRGRVTGPDNAPIQSVNVTATSLSGNVSRSSRSDKDGKFSITFPNGDGDYIVSFAILGFQAKRFEVKRTADQEFLIADAKLQTAAVQLDAMKVQQDRQRPDRLSGLSTDISGTERGLGGGILGADQMGDINAMAGSLPGFSYIPAGADGPGGFSVFGLDQAQNLTTLNGMPTGADGIPRDAGVASSISTSPYDVSRGGFSGASVNLRTRSGNNFIRRGLSFVGQAPQATWTDATGRATGAQQTMGSLGGAFSGPIKFNKAYYNISFQGNNTTKDLLSLLSQNDAALISSGVDPAVAHQVQSQIGAFGVPLSTSRVPGDNLVRSGSMVGALDFTPPSSTSGASYNVTFNGQMSKQTPAFLNSLDLPSRGAEQSSWSGGVQGRHNAYFGNAVLTETTLGASASNNENNPFLSLPSASVRVSSDLGGDAPVVRNLGFGGSQTRSSQNQLNQSFLNTLSWFSRNNKHKLKMTTELNYTHSSGTSYGNEFGTFTYQSLTDLQNNNPSSYSRQLTPRHTSLGNINGGWSIGDSYRPNQDFQLQYGVRLDGNHFTDLPAYNSAVETTFGVRNDRVPTPLYFSPRIGFTKTIGTAPEIIQFTGAFQAPRNVISGGVGLFQNAANTSGLSQAMALNGLPSGIQQLSCLGAETPVPNWTDLMTNPQDAPDTCRSGATATPLANNSPNVALFDKSFVSPRSLRSNLQWRGYPLNGRFSMTVNGTVSYNLNQQSQYDLNFDGSHPFAVDNEGDRPVYVDPANIVPTSGLISSRDARVSSSFNHVTQMRSDLTSHSEQMQVSVAPFNWNYSWRWNLTYTLQNTRDQVSGFQNTGDDPRTTSWARGFTDSRHDIRYNLSYLFFNVFNVNWSQGFRSGTPFTPMVSNDINGDGYFNDRAFVFDPNGTNVDPTVKAGMQSLLTSGSDAARECLKSQLNAIAARGSCEGPWTTNASLSISIDPTRARLPHRMGLSFSVSNPLAAADLMMHGEDKLHGWGQTPQPDAVLLNVKGFNATTKRFDYEVNQRFGSTSLQNTLSRSPVRIVAQARFDVGPTTERQLLTQQLDRGRGMPGQKVNEQLWKAQYSRGPVINPLAQVLQNADTMQLTRVQADSIAALNRWYTIRLDSIWTPIAKRLAEMPDKYDQDAAYSIYREGREASIDLLIKIAPHIQGLLKPAQTRKLGTFIAQYLDPKYLAYVRSGTASGGGPGSFGGPSIGAELAVTALAAGGGGGSFVIIR